MMKELYRVGRARLSWTLAWALLSGLAEGMLAVIVLFFYRACLLLALSAGALLFALFRIDSMKRKNGKESSLEE